MLHDAVETAPGGRAHCGSSLLAKRNSPCRVHTRPVSIVRCFASRSHLLAMVCAPVFLAFASGISVAPGSGAEISGASRPALLDTRVHCLLAQSEIASFHHGVSPLPCGWATLRHTRLASSLTFSPCSSPPFSFTDRRRTNNSHAAKF